MEKSKKNKIMSFYVFIILWLVRRVRFLRLYMLLSIRKIRNYLRDEAHDTREMIQIYKKVARETASKEEIKEANIQFFDLLKNLGIGAFLLLPFSLFGLPILIRITKSWGINILPTPSLRKKINEKKNDKVTKD